MNIVSRSEWGAQAPRRVIALVAAAVTHAIIHYIGAPGGSTVNGPAAMRSIQHDHRNLRGWYDFAYNFAVHPVTGVIYEGRGWGVADGASGLYWSGRSISILVMTNETGPPMSPAAVASVAWLVGEARRRFPLHSVVGHQQVGSTTCPGPDVMAHVRSGAFLKVAPQPPSRPKKVNRMIATAVNADGRAEDFRLNHVDPETGHGLVEHRWWIPGERRFSNWTPMHSNGDDPGRYDNVSAYRNEDGRLEVVAYTSAYGVSYRKWQLKPGGAWSKWSRY
jgi:hypothetical protein